MSTFWADTLENIFKTILGDLHSFIKNTDSLPFVFRVLTVIPWRWQKYQSGTEHKAAA